MKRIRIQTPRLRLEDLDVSDAEALYRYRSDPAVSKYHRFRPGIVCDAERFILENTCRFNEENSWFQVGIYLDGVLAGDLGIHFLGPDNSICELGYTVAPEYQGKGYAKEAVGSVIEYLFGKLGKREIIAAIDPENTASVRLAEGLGFRKKDDAGTPDISGREAIFCLPKNEPYLNGSDAGNRCVERER